MVTYLHFGHFIILSPNSRPYAKGTPLKGQGHFLSYISPEELDDGEGPQGSGLRPQDSFT